MGYPGEVARSNPHKGTYTEKNLGAELAKLNISPRAAISGRYTESADGCKVKANQWSLKNGAAAEM